MNKKMFTKFRTPIFRNAEVFRQIIQSPALEQTPKIVISVTAKPLPIVPISEIIWISLHDSGSEPSLAETLADAIDNFGDVLDFVELAQLICHKLVRVGAKCPAIYQCMRIEQNLIQILAHKDGWRFFEIR